MQTLASAVVAMFALTAGGELVKMPLATVEEPQEKAPVRRRRRKTKAAPAPQAQKSKKEFVPMEKWLGTCIYDGPTTSKRYAIIESNGFAVRLLNISGNGDWAYGSDQMPTGFWAKRSKCHSFQK